MGVGVTGGAAASVGGAADAGGASTLVTAGTDTTDVTVLTGATAVAATGAAMTFLIGGTAVAATAADAEALPSPSASGLMCTTESMTALVKTAGAKGTAPSCTLDATVAATVAAACDWDRIVGGGLPNGEIDAAPGGPDT